VLLTGQTGTHRSDRSGTAAAPSSVLRSWLCGSTKEPSGFLVNHRKPRELVVASANLHSWLGSHIVSPRPWFWGSTKKPSTTSSCCSCHHAAPHLTPLATGSLERSLLVFSTPGGLTGDDLSRLFFTCTSTSQATTCTCNT
jgi:hypothetical protein